MGPNERLLAAHKAHHAELMTRVEAIGLENALTDNIHKVRQIGTIRTTDEDNNTTTSEAFYSAEDILRLLDSGLSIRNVVASLGGVRVHG
jgi:hypothetical protein